MQSKSVAKSIIRTMEMNGTLETHPARLKSKEVNEKSEEETQDEEEEEEEDDDKEQKVAIRDVKKGNQVINTWS